MYDVQRTASLQNIMFTRYLLQSVCMLYILKFFYNLSFKKL